MKRMACLLLLTALGSPVFARESFSFMVHGHRIHIEASRHCRSLSCVSISGIGNWRRDRRDDDDVASVNNPAPASPSAPPPPSPPPAVAPPQSRPVYTPPPAQVPPVQAATPARIATRTQTMASVAPPQAVLPAPVQPAAVQAQAPTAPTLAAVPSTRVAPAQVAPPAPVPPQVSRADDKAGAKPLDHVEDRPQDNVEDKPIAAPRVSAKVAHAAQDEGDAGSPIGDWQTEGKGGLVRIEACGPALCGYVLNASTLAKGETVLVNMKPKKDRQWTGNVYSRSSGNSYYGTMTLKDGDTLRVEACALGSFFCSGNNWSRIEESRSVRPDVATSPRQALNPHS